jgi:hypothetical protein
MSRELIDSRLMEILPRKEYLRLKAEAEQAYSRIERQAPREILADLAELMNVMRAIEAKLLDERLGERNTDWAQGTMATLA